MGKTDAQRLFATFFVFAYALPLSIITTLYVLIVRFVKRHHQQQIVNGVAHRALVHPQQAPQQRHVTRVLVAVCATFAGCWLPLHLHLLVSYYGHTPNNIVYKILLIIWHALIFANSALNPIIYHCFSTDFREAFRAVMCRSRPQQPSPTSATRRAEQETAV